MVKNKKTNIGTALHLDPKRQAEAELKRQVIAIADDVFDRYVWGESFQSIADTLPFAITGFLAFLNPAYIMPLFETETGNIMLAVGLGWMFVGVLVMRKMIQFEI